MATKPFNKTVMDHVERRVDELLSRMYAQFPIPLSEEQQVSVWRGLYPKPVIEAYDTLRSIGYALSSDSTNQDSFLIILHNEVYRVVFVTRGNQLLRSSEQSLHSSIKVRLPDGDLDTCSDLIMSLDQASKLIPDLDGFTEWCKASSKFEREHIQAEATLRHFMGIITTCGQWARIVPELVTLLPLSAQADVKNSTKNSPWPDKWATYDKAAVKTMSDTIVRCMLMTDTDRQCRIFSHRHIRQPRVEYVGTLI